MTEKQAWARKRNWLIRRLKGAKSIFVFSNILFMNYLVQDKDVDCIYKCELAIDRLIKAIKKET